MREKIEDRREVSKVDMKKNKKYNCESNRCIGQGLIKKIKHKVVFLKFK